WMGVLMKRVLMIFFILFSAGNLVVGCSKIDGKVHANFKPQLDYLGSSLRNSGPVPADGSSELTLTIELKNSNGSAIEGVIPTFAISPSLGISARECTETDPAGQSTCLVRSITVGSMQVNLT